MRCFSKMKKITTEKNVVTLGTFDGVHLGHQRIISHAVDLARNIKGTSVVYTFSNHPISIIEPNRCPEQISSQKEKTKLIKALHVDILLNIPFTHQLLTISPEGFIEMLYDYLKPVVIVIGPNFSFGYKGGGTPNMLVEAGKLYGFHTEIPQAVSINNTIVSSTLIRKMIAEGNYEQAKRFLGRTLRSEVKTAV